MITFMKEPCEHCPFRRDVRPFLHAERGADLAYSTANPYNDFPCHKTIDFDDEGDSFTHPKSLTCAGFLSMQINECGDTIEGFEPSELVYGDPYEMADSYQMEEDGEWGDD